MRQRNKNIFLIIGFILVLIIAYQYAFSTTFKLRDEVKRLEANYSDPVQTNQLSSEIASRIKYADSVLTSNNANKGTVQSNLLEFLNRKSTNDDIVISEFKEPHVFEFQNRKSRSYMFSIKGNYKALEQTLYELEQDYAFGEVLHTSFMKLRNYRKQEDYLELTVLLNNYISD
jgi:hypothetical protein